MGKTSRLYPSMVAPDELKPLVESTRGAKIRVKREDIKAGVGANPYACALAQAAVRQRDVLAARFERTVAYIEYENRVEKFMLPEATKRAIAEFDVLGGRFAKPGLYDLSPVSNNRLLSTRSALNAAYRREGPTRPEGPTPQRGKRSDPLTMVGVRHGSGRIKTVVVAEQAPPAPSDLPFSQPWLSGKTEA